MISAGEVHLPGRPKDIVGLKALADRRRQRRSRNVRPAGVKVHAGAPILELGPRGARLRGARRGGRQPDRRGRPGLGEDGRPGGADARLGARSTAWCRRSTPAARRSPGSSAIRADVVLEARPDIVGHINGGTTALPDADIEQLVASGMAIEIVHCGNGRAALHAIGLARETRRAGSRDPGQRRAVGHRRRPARDPAHDGPPGLARRHRARDGRLPRHRQHRAGPPARDRARSPSAGRPTSPSSTPRRAPPRTPRWAPSRSATCPASG